MADYLTTDTELASVANAIRTKGGTSSPLVYPTGFVSAINAIPTGGGGIKYAKYETMNGEIFMFSEGDYLSEDELRYSCVFSGFCVDSNNSYASIAGSQTIYPDTLIFSFIDNQESIPYTIFDYSDGTITIDYQGSALEGYLYAFVVG